MLIHDSYHRGFDNIFGANPCFCDGFLNTVLLLAEMSRPLNQRVCEARIDVAQLLMVASVRFSSAVPLKQPVFLIMSALIASQYCVRHCSNVGDKLTMLVLLLLSLPTLAPMRNRSQQ